MLVGAYRQTRQRMGDGVAGRRRPKGAVLRVRALRSRVFELYWRQEVPCGRVHAFRVLPTRLAKRAR